HAPTHHYPLPLHDALPISQDREQDVASANAAWDIVAGMLKDDSYDLILLDELNIALKYEYIDLDRVLDDLQARPEMQHVVVTGRDRKSTRLNSSHVSISYA